MTIWTRPTNTFRYHTTLVWDEKDFEYKTFGGIVPDGVSDDEWISSLADWPLSTTMIRNLGGKGPATPDGEE